MIKLVKNFDEAIELIKSIRPEITQCNNFNFINMAENKDVNNLLQKVKNNKEPGYIMINPIYVTTPDPFMFEASRIRLTFLPKLFGENVLVSTGRQIQYKCISSEKIKANLNRNDSMDISFEEFSAILSCADLNPINNNEGPYTVYSAVKNLVCYSKTPSFQEIYQKRGGKNPIWSVKVKASATLASQIGHVYIGKHDIDKLVSMDFRHIGLGRINSELKEKTIMAISQKAFSSYDRQI